MFHDIECLEHAGLLRDLPETPSHLLPDPANHGAGDSGHGAGHPGPIAVSSNYTCTFCGVGDSGHVEASESSHMVALPASGEGAIRVSLQGKPVTLKVEFESPKEIRVETTAPLVASGAILAAEINFDGQSLPVIGVESGIERAGAPGNNEGKIQAQRFRLYDGTLRETKLIVKGKTPSSGCSKFNLSMGFHKPVFPYQIQPSALAPEKNNGNQRVSGPCRTPLTYPEAISRLADLLLEHRPPDGRTLVYCCGQIDYFSIFSFQEVFRILGIRSMTGNAEHCLNSGAVHNQYLTGQEGPFLTIEAATTGPNRTYLFNGWNGLITHPPVFSAILKRPDLDAYLVEVNVTESAKALASQIGVDRILMIKPGADPHLALAVAHEILENHSGAVARLGGDGRNFIDRWAEPVPWETFREMAASDEYEPARVAKRIAATPMYEASVLAGIIGIAARFADPNKIPINIPSMGLSQSKGIVSHCLWGNVLAMLGKYGIRPDHTPAGGTLRIPGQINAQSEVQGLSRKYFFGRIPIDDAGCANVARRHGLPETAFRGLLLDAPRAALDYSDPAPEKELMICIGTQFESNMPGRRRWLAKLADPNVTLVVIDPIADSYTMEHADLIIPPPPHSAVTKLMQNGEWRMFLSIPRKEAPSETRSDATIVYDVMAEISKRLRVDANFADSLRLRAAHPDLAVLSDSGYLRDRFESPESGGALPRPGGEVSRPHLWKRIQEYMADGDGRIGPLYCRPAHDDGKAIAWEEFLEKGNLIYGGVGTTRYVLDYDKPPEYTPFGDIFCRPGKFKFFSPTADDLRIPEGPILTSGRSCLSDDKVRMRFAVSSFNSGKATTAIDMPDENPLFISPDYAASLGVKDGDKVRITNAVNGDAMLLPVTVSDRVKGTTMYCSFHKSKAEIEEGRYINDVTDHVGRCPYTGQSSLKSTRVRVERVEAVSRTLEGNR